MRNLLFFRSRSRLNRRHSFTEAKLALDWKRGDKTDYLDEDLRKVIDVVEALPEIYPNSDPRQVKEIKKNILKNTLMIAPVKILVNAKSSSVAADPNGIYSEDDLPFTSSSVTDPTEQKAILAVTKDIETTLTKALKSKYVFGKLNEFTDSDLESALSETTLIKDAQKGFDKLVEYYNQTWDKTDVVGEAAAWFTKNKKGKKDIEDPRQPIIDLLRIRAEEIPEKATDRKKWIKEIIDDLQKHDPAKFRAFCTIMDITVKTRPANVPTDAEIDAAKKLLPKTSVVFVLSAGFPISAVAFSPNKGFADFVGSDKYVSGTPEDNALEAVKKYSLGSAVYSKSNDADDDDSIQESIAKRAHKHFIHSKLESLRRKTSPRR